MKDQKISFEVNPDNLKDVMPGDSVKIQFDDPEKKDELSWLCGNTYQATVVGTCIPGPEAHHGTHGEPKCVHQLWITPAISTDRYHHHSTLFPWDETRKSWNPSVGGSTHCTIMVIERRDNIPLEKLTKTLPGDSEEYEIIP